MGWSVGYDENWKRWVGYGVPAICDHPGCNERIDRGLAHVCGSDPFGQPHGCGLHFCGEHLFFDDIAPPSGDDEGTYCCSRCSGDDATGSVMHCKRCVERAEPFDPKPDVPEWTLHVLHHPSWEQWRTDTPEEAKKMADMIPRCQGLARMDEEDQATYVAEQLALEFDHTTWKAVAHDDHWHVVEADVAQAQ